MCMHKALKWGLLVVGLTVSITGITDEVSVNLGTPLTESEISRVSITIFPNGQNLPKGQGSVVAGEKLYVELCAACHGESGTEGPSIRLTGSIGLFSFMDPLRIIRIQEVNGLLVMSTGQQWPYATSIFDFVRRSMPHFNPKSLTNNEVYSLTAYVLYLNDLVDKDAVIDRKTLPGIEMPAFKRYVRAWENKTTADDFIPGSSLQ